MARTAHCVIVLGLVIKKVTVGLTKFPSLLSEKLGGLLWALWNVLSGALPILSDLCFKMRDEGLSQDLPHLEHSLLLLDVDPLLVDRLLLHCFEVLLKSIELDSCFLFERSLFIVLGGPARLSG